MVVLVRWEPVVHDDYPWVIPFWVDVTGIPLHLWTIKNLQNIGNILGHIDTVELTAGRMLIDVDTRKPLTFTRKIASPEGEEALNTQGDRTGVFARVQLPMNEVSRQSLLRDEKPFEKCDLYGRFDYGKSSRLSNSLTRKESHADGFMKDAWASHYRNDTQNYRHGREHSGCRKALSEWRKQHNVNSVKLVEELKEKVEGLYADDNATTEEIAAALKELSEALKAKKMF
ncbi:hypothetical protein DY000_02014948 [Brassica cretica]|uniref:DUF4283 domain-containing protein n=1 Tax=Brassica cretica TaxID=69181 RepID=A0ABQ7DCT1_BRACR|nr:hypothetical protein DY000_02014948 [Brassica cretica]